MALCICASVTCDWKAAAVMSSTFIFLPCSVSPLPSPPWHEAHFAFHIRCVFLSGSVTAFVEPPAAAPVGAVAVPVVPVSVVPVLVPVAVPVSGVFAPVVVPVPGVVPVGVPVLVPVVVP